MALEANALINIRGRPFMLSKHYKKSSLIEIIAKLQYDLSKIREFTKNQADYKIELENLKLEYGKLQENMSNENNNKENQDKTNRKIYVFEKRSNIRASLEENYHKKACKAMQLYEGRIDLLKKQIDEIDKDRETYAEAIETKQTTIKSLKQQIEHLKKEKDEQEYHHNEALNDLKQKTETEKHQTESQIQKLVTDNDVLQKTYVDLDKIRKYLEKNNAALKSSLKEAYRITDDRIKKLSTDYEEKEAKYSEEIQKMHQGVKAVVQEAEQKIEMIEGKLAKQNEMYHTRITEVIQENDKFKGVIQSFEQNEQTLKGELTMYKNLVEQTKRFYEDSIRASNEKFREEKNKLDQEVRTLKSNYETEITELKTRMEVLEGEVYLKARKITELQSENVVVGEKVDELNLKIEENDKNYAENYNLLKEETQTMKNTYQGEKCDLKTLIDIKNKIIDDLNLEKNKLEKQIKCLICSNDQLKQENKKDWDEIYRKSETLKESYAEELQKLKENHNKRIKLLDNDLQQANLDNDVLNSHYNELLSTKQNLDKTCRKLRLELNETEMEYRKQLRTIKEDNSTKEKSLEEQIDTQNRELLQQKKLIQTLENETTKLKSKNEELEKTIEGLEIKNKEEVQRFQHLIEENSNFYKEDLQNVKHFLSYKEELIKKLEKKLNDQEIKHNLAINEKQEEINNKKLIMNEITTNYEIKKQKYDILIYEFYKELKEQQSQTDELTRIKEDLEQENTQLKKRNSDIFINLTKQKDKFRNDSEIMKLFEYLST